MPRPNQQAELAPFIVAQADSSYITGQVIHVNGDYITT